MPFFESLNFWHWLILGVVLFIFELLTPSNFLMWIGIAAILTGLSVPAFAELGWQYQVMLFAVLSVIAVAGGRIWARRQTRPEDHPDLNRRGRQYIDRVFTLDEAIVNGVGRLKVGDGAWKVSGEDTPAGTRVKVVGIEGTTLQVEKAEADAS